MVKKVEVLPLTPDILATEAANQKDQAITNLVYYINRELIGNYVWFYLQGWVEVSKKDYDPEWIAFHAEAIQRFKERLWFGEYKIYRADEDAVHVCPDGKTWHSPVYRFYLPLPREEKADA